MLRIGIVDERTRAALRRLATVDDARIRVGKAVGITEHDAGWHLVISGGSDPDCIADVHLERPEEIGQLWRDRIVPYSANLVANRRAPRRQQSVLDEPDRGWTTTAHRIGTRLRRVLGPSARRIDHIGSTSIQDLPAKNIIDLQIVVDTLNEADRACEIAVHAGLVPVRNGDFYAIDRHDRRHAERILVDADPGRSVNVHLHPTSSPVWQETLTFRDWLRSVPSARNEYLGFKRNLVEHCGGDVNEYSRAKREWVNDAVDRAQRWATSTGRQPYLA